MLRDFRCAVLTAPENCAMCPECRQSSGTSALTLYWNVGTDGTLDTTTPYSYAPVPASGFC